MYWSTVAFLCLLSGLSLYASEGQKTSLPAFDYEVARAHEIKPHRRTIPIDGAGQGFNQLHLKLTVSPTGDVTHAESSGSDEEMKFWPKLEGEVYQWKFTPFEMNGKAVTAEVEEYIDFVPPERLPKTHVAAPAIKLDSKIEITLQRSGCYGACPSYTVTVGTNGIVFEGGGFVVARGKHTDKVDKDAVLVLAKRFSGADFYSMGDRYHASVTDNPSYCLSISIDGHTKSVYDYVGQWVGMPAVISELEDEVDAFARTKRWIEGADGLVAALREEKFPFQSVDAQVILKEAARRGQTATVQQLLEAGVPVQALAETKASPEAKDFEVSMPFKDVGWLNAASAYPETLRVLLDAGASKNDQKDKDLALAHAAEEGKVESVRALIASGANPNADLSKLTVTQESGNTELSGHGAGSVLINAAQSGNPDVVREILKYHPKLEARGSEGKTAMFAAGEYRYNDVDGARVECVRLLAKAGADVNARDDEGNTPLHETSLTDVEEELLKLGADVNARNEDGETPIFTTEDDDALPMFIKHGADLTIRNKKGETVVEAAKEKEPQRQEALRKAIAEAKSR